MIENIVTRFLEGKQLGPLLKRLFSLLFVASTTSMLLGKGCYSTNWMELSDAKQAVSFVLGGHYFIPVLVFFAVWYITKSTAVVFSLINLYYSRKYTKKIVQIRISDKRWQEHTASIKLNLEQELPGPLRQEWYITLYEEIRQSTKPTYLNELRTGLSRWQKQIDAKWVFGIRALLFTSSYFFTSTTLNVWLFGLILLSIAVWLFTLFVKYQFAELLPVMMRKFNYEMEAYLNRCNSQNPASKQLA